MGFGHPKATAGNEIDGRYIFGADIPLPKLEDDQTVVELARLHHVKNIQLSPGLQKLMNGKNKLIVNTIKPSVLLGKAITAVDDLFELQIVGDEFPLSIALFGIKKGLAEDLDELVRFEKVKIDGTQYGSTQVQVDFKGKTYDVGAYTPKTNESISTFKR